VTKVIEVSASAAYHLAGTRFWAAWLGHLGQMPWRQHSTWLPRRTSMKCRLNLSASGDHVNEQRTVREPVNIGYGGFGGAA
jgi:hypothetical protein